jgi:DNA helicase II / ATP-dependent DNA helicase PcrA
MPLETLSPEQRAVVDHRSGDLFVLACPGAGKTYTVVERFIDRGQGLAHKNGIAIVSFSRVAAAEVQRRCYEQGIAGLLTFPHFVGTLDSFFIRYLHLPLAQAWTGRRVRVLDSWESIDARVQLTGSKAVKGKGVPLDAFPFDGHSVQFDAKRLRGKLAGWRGQIQRNKADWERAATARRKGLRAAGLRTCEDMRIAVAQTLEDETWSFVLRALAGRFSEVIVDEAQDCDEFQISALSKLRDAGVRLILVADVDQAIYEFRKASPAALKVLASPMKWLGVRGNRRGSPAICAVANSMVPLERADTQAVGATRDCDWPVEVIPYEPGGEQSAGVYFCSRARERGLETLIVAHARSLALRAAGLETVSGGRGGRSGSLLQSAFRILEGDSDGKARVASVREIELLVLRRLGANVVDLTAEDVCIAERVERRWLRASVVALVRRVRELIGERNEISLGEAVSVARAALEALAPPAGRAWAHSPTRMFKNPPGDQRDLQLSLVRNPGPTLDLRVSTVHGVKGEGADAVLLVLSSQTDAAEGLLRAWEERSVSDEAKRVAYVGVTRAKRLLGRYLSTPMRHFSSRISEAQRVSQ